MLKYLLKWSVSHILSDSYVHSGYTFIIISSIQTYTRWGQNYIDIYFNIYSDKKPQSVYVYNIFNKPIFIMKTGIHIRIGLANTHS